MQAYSRPNPLPKCKHVRKCKTHQPSALVIVFDKARAKMPISKPCKQGIHHEFSIFSM